MSFPSRIMYPDSKSPAPQRANLSDVVNDAAPELRCLLGPRIGIFFGELPAGNAAEVALGPSELVDLLRHLALDAHAAMPAGGTVTIRTGLLGDAVPYAAIVIHEAPSAAATRGRKGRSLGLGASYDAIQRADGHFHVSCRGRETVLTICFPLAR